MNLRPLRWRDTWTCWKLACDPEERRWARDHSKPTLWGHLKWMRKRAAPTWGDSGGWLILDGHNRTMGMVRVDCEGPESELGVVVFPEHRGKGWGMVGIRIVAAAAAKVESIKEVTAYIRPDNTASRETFHKAGFNPDGVGEDGLLRYVYEGGTDG